MKQIFSNHYLDAAAKTMLLSASVHIILIITLAITQKDLTPVNYFDIIGASRFVPAAVTTPLGHIIAFVTLAGIYGLMIITQRKTSNNRDIVLNFLSLAASGRVNEAYDRYVDMTGKHHNAYFPAGFSALQQAMKDAHAQSPNKRFSPKLTLCDGDLVAVHSCVERSTDSPKISVVHIARIRDGKITELWDTGMEIPTQCPNTDGVF
jgi:predicted SnoaL-like aldol condensation-catalyzing enzyme